MVKYAIGPGRGGKSKCRPAGNLTDSEFAMPSWTFGNARFDEATHTLSVAGSPVALERKPLEVLLCLLRAEGELVTKEELIESVWRDRVVTDGVLSQAVKRIRAALHDTDRSMLRTVHGYGFRLDLPISCEGAEDTGAHLELLAGMAVPGLEGWRLEERLGSRPHNELWRLRQQGGATRKVIKLALNERATGALKREVTLNRVLRKELGDDAPLVPLEQWQFEVAPAWILMPWYPAGSLVDWIEREGGVDILPLPRRVGIVAEAAELLARAHALGVMHKDIKPGNLLVDESGAEPHLRLCDFGSGTLASRERLEHAGVTVMGFTQTVRVESATGTPAYMAPEVLAGGVFSERSDVYSLGVLLFQLVSGDLHQALAPGWEDDVADAGLRQIIAAACAGRPERRIASMQALASELRHWRPEQGASIRRMLRRSLRSPVPLIALAIAAMALALVLPDSPGVPGNGQRKVAGPPNKRLAVLPFRQLGVDAETGLILSGLHEAVIADLGAQSDWRLVMADHAAALGLAATDVGAIGALTRADLLLRGSVQQIGSSLQINAQIIDTRSGETRWARSIPGGLDELFGMQHTLSHGVRLAIGVDAVRLSVTSRHPDAYAEYLAAMAIGRSDPVGSGKMARFDDMLVHVDRALALEPHFLEAHWLALEALSYSYWHGHRSGAQTIPRAREQLEQILRLETQPEMRAYAQALGQMYLDMDAGKAAATLRPWLSQIAGASAVQNRMGEILFHAGDLDGAEDAFLRAQDATPGAALPVMHLYWLYLISNRYSDAYRLMRHAQARMPDNPAHALRAETVRFATTSDLAHAQQAIARIESFPVRPWQLDVLLTELYLSQGEPERALRNAKQIDEIIVPMATGMRGLTPIEGYRAFFKKAAGANPVEVRRSAERGVAQLEANQALLDPDSKQIVLAMFHGVAGNGAAAQQALAQISATHTQSVPMRAYWLLMAKTIGAAAAGDRTALLATLDMALRASVPLNCWAMRRVYVQVMIAPFAEARDRIESFCGPLLEEQARKIRAFDARSEDSVRIRRN